MTCHWLERLKRLAPALERQVQVDGVTIIMHYTTEL